MNRDIPHLSLLQQVTLVALRTFIGWHFLYEGYVKLVQPAWGRDGHPLQAWSSAGYLRSATGPLGSLFQRLGDVSWIGSLDLTIAIVLVAIGVSLLLGLLTQAGCIGAMAMLTLFYLSAPPLGLAEARTEGSYLIVNKNLIELTSVAVLFMFRTGRIAGLDARSLRSPIVVTAAKEATV